VHESRPDSGQSSSQTESDILLTTGALIRELRSLVGWSQSRLADELGKVSGHPTVTRECVSRWEHGKRAPGPYWVRHLATALQVPLTILEQAERMERRVFLTDLGTTALASLTASDLIQHGFAAALRTRPSPDAWNAKLTAYSRDYMTMGADDIRKRIAADLIILQQQLESPAMWQVAARLMTLYGKTFPGTDGAKASGWYRMAAVTADRSGDTATRVWVRGRAAIALGYEGAALPIANLFAGQAIGLDPRPSLGRLNAIMGKAHAAALVGNSDAAVKLLAQARRTFDAAASADSEISDNAVPWWRMNVFTSLLAARLGDEKVALRASEAASASLPPSLPRFRTHLEMHKGLMLVRAGDKAGGQAHARAALAELPPQKHSLTLRMLLAEIDRAA
jgi:transcriptional regulator with XRE-family HTH domain